MLSPAVSQPWQGRHKIVEEWLAHRDERRQTEFEWRVLTVADDKQLVSRRMR
jgi:hypothetical protein